MSTTLSCMIWFLIFITRSSLTNGYIELILDGNDGNEATDYLDFSITTNRLQLQLTQLDDNADLEFSVEAGVFERDSQSSQIALLTYKWNTHSGRNNILSLYDTSEFEQCDETKTEMLKSIPSKVTVDLNTDYLVEIKGGEQGTFSSLSTVPCPAVWTSFTSNRAKVTKMKLKLVDDDDGYTLENIYTVEYRIITACNPGQYLDAREGSCTDCETDHYGAGVWLESCTKCPEAKGVEAGKGTKESDCTWKPCEAGQRLNQAIGCEDCPADHWSASGNTAASCTVCTSGKEVGAGLGKGAGDCNWKDCSSGQYLDQATGCKNCLADHWSVGGQVAQCTQCPAEKGVSAGAGTSEADCTWKPCEAGQHLDQTNGCENCPPDHWSAAGNEATTCTACAAEKGVGAGLGKQAGDCTWKDCSGGQYLDQATGCKNCLADHWSAGGQVAQCTQCPSNKGVAAGAGASEADCTWKPCEAGQRLNQAIGCENCPADHWSGPGNTAASCTVCTAGKEVGAGFGKEAGDCNWKPCTNGGQYLDQATGCQLCGADTWGSPGSTSATCTPCPTDKGVAAGAGSSEDDCTWKGCAGGQYLEQSSGCQNCLADHWSPVGSKSPTCSNCPADKEVAAGQGKLESDCTWKACAGGQYLNQENGCTNCEAGEFSAGGTADSCTKCEADTYSEAGATKCTACPSGKVVASGGGKQESDCTFKSCLGGYYVDATKGCLPCEAGEFSAGGTADSCTKCEADTYSADKATKCTDCPSGKGVASGDGKEEVDCKWKPCAGGHYLDQDKGCLTCKAGEYSVGGTAASCSTCLKNQYSAVGASQCTDCPAGTGGVAAGTGTEEAQCKEIVWKMTGAALIQAVAGTEPQIVSGSQGVLVVTTANEVEMETANVTFCNSGYDNTTANMICQLLGFGDGTFGSSPQNFKYVPESLLSSMSMPRLAGDDCAGNLLAISAECVGKMMATSCEQDEVVWIKCAEVIDDRDDSSSTKISAAVTLVIVNIGFALFW
ncbi:major surface-labeled trophozoite antigen 417-like isoform X4 [Bolinopsis microptera]|uniref:major surface-labeled trophozoite antigen 417-like isoform X4 n=1 Tax=Bolinopsis microptera TaxID=2820187 RepID=UPI00307ABE56